MLFKEETFNCEKYSFVHDPNLSKEEYSYNELCKELSVLTEKIQQAQYPIECQEKDILNHTVTIQSCKESVLNRGYNEIHNIICRKPEFKNRLKRLNIHEPEDKGSYNFALYLQFVYFFYCMIYFIYPDVKFMDLFLEKNWSVEHTLEASTGNEIYEDFILKNMCQNASFKVLKENTIKEYDKAIGYYTDAFFDYYQMHYDSLYTTFSKENSQSFVETIKSYQSKIDSKIHIDDMQNRTIYQDFLDFQTSYTTLCTHNDFYKNYLSIDFEKLLEVKEKMIDELPEDYYETMVFKEDLDALMQDEEFICICMNENHLTNTNKNKFDSYNIKETIIKIWNYEVDQLTLYPYGDGFTFIKKEENDYYMLESDLAIMAICRICIPYQMKYISKRLYLTNRSDSSKKAEHSLKESFKSTLLDGLDPSQSVFRDDLFRIVCRMLQLIYLSGDASEFLYYELPMNTMAIEFCEKAESYPYVEQRIQYYKQATNFFQKEMK